MGAVVPITGASTGFGRDAAENADAARASRVRTTSDYDREKLQERLAKIGRRGHHHGQVGAQIIGRAIDAPLR